MTESAIIVLRAPPHSIRHGTRWVASVGPNATIRLVDLGDGRQGVFVTEPPQLILDGFLTVLPVSPA